MREYPNFFLNFPNLGFFGEKRGGAGPSNSPSPNTEAAQRLITKAFAAGDSHLEESRSQHTVIMVQVRERNPGHGTSVRGTIPSRFKNIRRPSPRAELLKSPTCSRPLNMRPLPEVLQKVFGNNDRRIFPVVRRPLHRQVAAAGKAEYPLPLYVNAALRESLSNQAQTTYLRDGGPTR